jgi:hypothetical protein
MSPDGLYDELGGVYSRTRRTDPRIAALLWAALGDPGSVLNVGAGTGSYEPSDREVVGVEPSAVMRGQRPAGSGRCICGVAEALPFADASFDVAMAVFSDWFWADRGRAFAEMRRVARRRVVVLTLDRSVGERFWLASEYLRGAHELWPPFDRTLADFGECEVIDVPIPADCIDGFFHAFWRRPHAYLDPRIREPMAVFERLDRTETARGLDRLAADLEAGRWRARHGELLRMDALDLGYRLLVRELGPR